LGDEVGEEESRDDCEEKAGVGMFSVNSEGEDIALKGGSGGGSEGPYPELGRNSSGDLLSVSRAPFSAAELDELIWVRPCFLRSCDRLKLLPQIVQENGFNGV